MISLRFVSDLSSWAEEDLFYSWFIFDLFC